MLSLVTKPFLLVVVSCFLTEFYAYCKLFFICLRYLLVRWVGQGRVSFVGMSVTLVLTCAGSILHQFRVSLHLQVRWEGSVQPLTATGTFYAI
jgi:hypothetical protein